MGIVIVLTFCFLELQERSKQENIMENIDAPRGWTDPAIELDRGCTFDPNQPKGVDGKGTPVCKEEGMFPGDPAIVLAVEQEKRSRAAAVVIAEKEL